MQLWVSVQDASFYIHLVSIWKVSLDPGAAWTNGPPLNLPFWQDPFIPDPGYICGGGIAAGSSPDGRVQLWIAGEDGGLPVLESTWTTSGDPDSGWFTWQKPFLPDAGQLSGLPVVAVGQLSDGRMQLWTIAQRGRDVTHLISTWKTSKDPGAAWAPWQDPFDPDPGLVESVAVGQLADGRLKLWVIRYSLQGGYQIFTCEKATADPDAGWTDWQVFGNLYL
jgi:hypothetical protein